MVVSLAGQFNPAKIPYLPGVNSDMSLWTGNPGLGGSVFGTMGIGGLGFPMGGLGFPMGGLGFPMGGSAGVYGTNPQKVKDFDDYARLRTENRIIQKRAKNFLTHIDDNETTKALDDYKKLSEAISKEDGYKAQETLEDQAQYIHDRISQLTGGIDIEDYIREKLHGGFCAFWTGAHSYNRFLEEMNKIDGTDLFATDD